MAPEVLYDYWTWGNEGGARGGHGGTLPLGMRKVEAGTYGIQSVLVGLPLPYLVFAQLSMPVTPRHSCRSCSGLHDEALEAEWCGRAL